MKRLVVDSQPQFVLIHDHHVYTTWSGSLEELEAEAIEVAAKLGVPVEELKAHYRVMVTVTSMLTPVGEVGSCVDFGQRFDGFSYAASVDCW